MKTLLLVATVLCMFLSLSSSAQKITRVNKSDAERMKALYGKTEMLKISREDLDEIINLSGTGKAANDTFVFFLVKLGKDDVDRYVSKFKKEEDRQGMRENLQRTITQQRPTTALVGFIPGSTMNSVRHLTIRPLRTSIPVYDVSVVCPPPPDCNCEIE